MRFKGLLVTAFVGLLMLLGAFVSPAAADEQLDQTAGLAEDLQEPLQELEEAMEEYSGAFVAGVNSKIDSSSFKMYMKAKEVREQLDADRDLPIAVKEVVEQLDAVMFQVVQQQKLTQDYLNIGSDQTVINAQSAYSDMSAAYYDVAEELSKVISVYATE